MKMNALTIRRAYSWETPKSTDGPLAPYKGEVEFEGSSGTVKLQLGDDLSRAVLAVVADQLVETSKSVAERLTRDVIESAGPALEPPAEEVSHD